MLGVITNALAVIAGALIGTIFKKYIPKNLGDVLFKAVGLCVIYIGIDGALKGENTLILIISIIIGTLIGTLLKLEDRFYSFSENIEKKLVKNSNEKNEGKQSLASGFVSASLLFCVGAMAVVGSLQAGISGDNTMLFTKSALDGISSIVFASTMGAGVFFSSIVVLLYQGVIALLANIVSPFLTTACVNEMTSVGSILIMTIGLNMLSITKIKIMDMLPAVFIPVIIFLFI